ncbi:MAG: PAN domain-containing protein [Pseudomonadota bacterium]
MNATPVRLLLRSAALSACLIFGSNMAVAQSNSGAPRIIPLNKNSGLTTGSVNLPGFTRVPKAAIRGHNKKRLSNVTPQQCAAACASEASFACVSFDYRRNTKQCDLSDKRSSDVGGLRKDFAGSLYDHYERSTAALKPTTTPEREKVTAAELPRAKPAESEKPKRRVESQRTPRDKRGLDVAMWTTIRNSDDPDLFKAYLKRFPKGVFAAIAKEKLEILDQPQETAKASPEKPVRKAIPEKPLNRPLRERAALQPLPRTNAPLQPERPRNSLTSLPEKPKVGIEAQPLPRAKLVPPSSSSGGLTADNRTADQLIQAARAAATNGNGSEATRLLQLAGQKGSSEAWFVLGWMYETGDAVPADLSVAAQHYQKANANGYPGAWFRLLLIHDRQGDFSAGTSMFLASYKDAPAAVWKIRNRLSEDLRRAIQTRLSETGHYLGAIDAAFGTGTRQAVESFSGRAEKPTETREARLSPPNDEAVETRPVVPQVEQRRERRQRRIATERERALAGDLQLQLQRVGCYYGFVDGVWGGGSARAMRNFNRWAGERLPINRPTRRALETVLLYDGPLCGVD